MKYKNEEVTEAELYKKLGLLTKNKDEWESSISDVAALLKKIFLTNIDVDFEGCFERYFKALC